MNSLNTKHDIGFNWKKVIPQMWENTSQQLQSYLILIWHAERNSFELCFDLHKLKGILKTQNADLIYRIDILLSQKTLQNQLDLWEKH